MDLYDRIKTHFNDSMAVNKRCSNELIDPIAQAAECMSQAILQGKKILACGNGGSAADAQHFAAEMLNRFELERPSLPAIALTTDSSTLTAIGNDYNFNEIFAKQLRALGQEGDVLLAISTSGQSENIIQAVQVGLERGMRIIALTGNQGVQLVNLLSSNDVVICVPASSTPRIQEMHVLALHCICDLIDQQLFVGDETTFAMETHA